jgi:hypothetical protein
MAKNKIIFGDTVLIDLTMDSLTASKLLVGYTAHDRGGEAITGSCTFDADTSDADATDATILSGKTAYVNANKVTGAMPNRGEVVLTIDDVNDELQIQNGYHDGSGVAKLDATEKAKIIAGNIKKDIEILGVTGTYEGAATPTSAAKTVTPYTTSKTYLPSGESTPVDYYSQVTVNAIAYTETPNTYGTTVTIGDVDPDA